MNIKILDFTPMRMTKFIKRKQKGCMTSIVPRTFNPRDKVLLFNSQESCAQKNIS